jgi:hypothetical protein
MHMGQARYTGGKHGNQEPGKLGGRYQFFVEPEDKKILTAAQARALPALRGALRKKSRREGARHNTETSLPHTKCFDGGFLRR